MRRVVIAFVLGSMLTMVAPRAEARPRATPEGVVFTFDAPAAGQVTLSGSFNSWSPTAQAMARAEGSTWQAALRLEPGRYEYKFVVDGKDWRPDPDNPLSVPDPYGGKNSVLVVRADGSLDFSARSGGRLVEPVVGSLAPLGKPLRLAILWHQHQPRYFKDPATGEFLEPWVRIHGIKDYYDMVAILERYPEIKFTVNLTPVLLSQLEEMIAAWRAFAARVPSGGRPDAIPGCDRWVRLALTPPEALTDEDKALILQNCFRMPRETMIDPHPRFAELADGKRGDSPEGLRLTIAAYTDRDWRDLQAWFNLAEFDPDFQEGEVVLPDGRTASVAGLVAKGRDFTDADLVEIIATQFKILENIVEVHKRFAARGQIEVITSPFYHPILPLVCDTDVAAEADPSLELPSRFAYPEDARAQVEAACEAHRAVFGSRPRGMWPSEGSVSDAVVPIAAAAGLDWIASDEEVLAKSLGRSPLGAEHKYRMYYVSRDGARVGVIFRDHRMSDEIGFLYSKMSGVEGANELVRKLYDVAVAMQAHEGDYVVPIIMDGENAWEQYERDGKDFFHSLYSQLASARWLETVTVSEAFEAAPPTETLGHLAPGSWITPNFNTWIGEPEENKAWEYLTRARAEVAARAAALPPATRDAVMNEVYIAEGSDWFWWYGLDQGSGNDESFDGAFRGTLGRIYDMLGLARPDHLSVPIVSAAPREPTSAIRGTISPSADGAVSGPAEWAEAGYMADSEAGAMARAGGDLLAGLYYGYDKRNLWLRIDTGVSPEALAARGCRASVCLSGPSDLGAVGNPTFGSGPESRSHFFGFGVSSRVDIDLGAASAALLAADGAGGWTTKSALPVGISQVIEIAVPFAQLGLGTGADLRLGAVCWCPGGEDDVIPDRGFAGFKIPPLGDMTSLIAIRDPRGDDHGPGGYTYPSDPVFVAGAFDVTSLEMMLDPEDNLAFKLAIAGDVTWPWGGITGYSLQAVDIYIDTDGLPDSGQRELFSARRARTAAANAWEYFIRASMDSVALYDSGFRRVEGVKVTSYADPATRSIFVKLPRSALAGAAAEGAGGTQAAGVTQAAGATTAAAAAGATEAPAGRRWNVIVALLSHDGYSPGGVRPIKADREQWVFGGCDQESLCPGIIDLVVEGDGRQEQILGAYRSTAAPAEIPGIGVLIP
ncbi:MAG: glucodextranase DOMON-like domain-containing protein [bacterium]